MGIKGLGKFLQAKCPGAFRQYLVSAFAGKRIAIDLSTWVHANFAIARKKRTDSTDIIVESVDREAVDEDVIRALGYFTIKFLDAGITPVFVKDGKAPREKDNLRLERKAVKDKHMGKALVLRQEIDGMDPLEITPEKEAEYRKALYVSGEVTFDLVNRICDLLHNAGICVLEANGEAEKLCSMMCIEGRVSAVFSTDTDNLVYECPLLITGYGQDIYERSGTIRTFDVIEYNRVLTGLGIDSKFFRDLCIFNGCDYNTKMSGIALTKAFTILKKYGSIEAYSQVRDTKCLNYSVCRRLFSYVSAYSMVNVKLSYPGGPLSPSILNISRQRFLSAERQTWMTERLISAYNKLPVPVDITGEFTIIIDGYSNDEDNNQNVVIIDPIEYVCPTDSEMITVQI